jgi:hypothetical protein
VTVSEDARFRETHPAVKAAIGEDGLTKSVRLRSFAASVLNEPVLPAIQ